MKNGRRYGLVASVAALCLLTGLTGTGFASPAGGVRGDPQPELKPFQIGSLGATSAGAIAMEPNGSMVAVYDVGAGGGRLQVCVLDRGKNACSSKTELSMPSGDSPGGMPEVFIPSANHVVVLQGACCDSNPNGGDLLFSSTDGGRIFGPGVPVGDLGVDGAVLIGNQVVFTESYGGPGAQTESISLTSPGPPPSTAIATPQEAF